LEVKVQSSKPTSRTRLEPQSEATDELRLHPLARYGDRVIFFVPFFEHFSLPKLKRGRKGVEYQLRIRSRTAIEMYGLLVFRADRETRSVAISRGEIARKLGMDRGSVKRSLDLLKRLKMIEVGPAEDEPWGSRTRPRTQNTYTLIPQTWWPRPKPLRKSAKIKPELEGDADGDEGSGRDSSR
jgi:hypothetical protein